MSHEWAEPWRTPSRRPIVKVEEPAESLAAMNATGAPPRKHRTDEFIADTLTPVGSSAIRTTNRRISLSTPTR